MFKGSVVWFSVFISLLSILNVEKHLALAGGDTDLRNIKCPPRTQVCLPHGSCCVFGEQYCSGKSGTCEDVPWRNEDRLQRCCNTLGLGNNETKHDHHDILVEACYWEYGSKRLEQECNSLKKPKNNPGKGSVPVAWQTIGFYITLPLLVVLLIALVVQNRRRHFKRHRCFGRRGVADVERDNKVNTLRNVATNQPLINHGQGNGTNEETSALTLENLGHTAPVTQNVPGTQNGAAFQNGTAFQNGAAFQNGPGLVQRQNSNSNPSPQTTLEVGNLNLSPSDGPRTIHCDQATDHEYPGGIVPSGKEYRE